MSLLLEEPKRKRKSREDALAETPAELQDCMRPILSDQNLLTWIQQGLADIGIAGEQRLALTVYLTGLSRLLDHPLAIIVQGPSSSGKSYVLERVASLFPEEAVLSATDMTPQALYYLPPGELEHRFIVSGERSRRQNDETAQGTKALREMLSSGKLSKLIPVSDGDGPHTEHIHQKGPIAYAESTTATEIFEEDANRCLVLQPDDRAEQTQRIKEALAYRLSGQTSSADREQRLREFHCLDRMISSRRVAIPFIHDLFQLIPNEPVEVRRAIRHVGSMIQVSALLHQYQRAVDDQGQVVAQAEDYWLARLLLEPVLIQSLGDKPAESLQRFVGLLRKLSGEYTAKEISSKLKMNERTVREQLNQLLQRGLIKQTVNGRGPIPARWLIPSELSLNENEAQILPTVYELFGVDEDQLRLPEMSVDWGSGNLSDVPF